MSGIWAVLPVKEFVHAKQRLAPRLAPPERQALAAAMVEAVLAALGAARGLAGIVVVTMDPLAADLAARIGARVQQDGARDGHTGAVTAAARALARDGAEGMLTVPGDIPAVSAAEIEQVLAARGPAPSFTIVPAHDGRGSNAILCMPPDAVPLQFGDDSFLPHLRAARAHGIEPTILRLPGIGMDIDGPDDLARLAPSDAPLPAGLALRRALAL